MHAFEKDQRNKGKKSKIHSFVHATRLRPSSPSQCHFKNPVFGWGGGIRDKEVERENNRITEPRFAYQLFKAHDKIPNGVHAISSHQIY